MRFSTLVLAATLCALPGAAVAQTPPAASPAATTAAPSLPALSARLEKDGFQVLEIERYPRSVEVKGRDKAGACVELRLDPKTGDILRRESDDDCDSGRHDRGRRDRH